MLFLVGRPPLSFFLHICDQIPVLLGLSHHSRYMDGREGNHTQTGRFCIGFCWRVLVCAFSFLLIAVHTIFYRILVYIRGTSFRRVLFVLEEGIGPHFWDLYTLCIFSFLYSNIIDLECQCLLPRQAREPSSSTPRYTSIERPRIELGSADFQSQCLIHLDHRSLISYYYFPHTVHILIAELGSPVSSIFVRLLQL